MKLDIVPVSLRKLRPSNVGNYKDYLDMLIGMKLREWDRIKTTITSPRPLGKAIR